MNKGFGFLFEMGCGKTLTAIAVAGAGYQQKRIARVLIVAPTSVVAVWPKEFQDYAAFPYTIRTCWARSSSVSRPWQTLSGSHTPT